MKRYLIMLLVVMFAAPLTACNTMEGVGKDVKSAGGAVEDAAKDCGDKNGCDDND